MTSADETALAVKSIRHFNRYYTNRLELLARYRFDTNFTLTEARVIFEIGRRGVHTQSGLRSELKIDVGYLSRVVKRLIAEGFIESRTDKCDRRIAELQLTESGWRAHQNIDRASDQEVSALLRGLGKEDVVALMTHFREAERILEGHGSRPPLVEAVEEGPAIATVRVLMREYLSFLGVDLSFQGFEEEMAGLPGKYAHPEGALFLAAIPMSQGGAEPAGCVALRKLEAEVCEMKRLFVRAEYRGFGVGKALAKRVIAEARNLRYKQMRLDTLERLGEAVSLYKSLGFVAIPAYNDNPLPDARFWEKDLTQ